MPLLFFYFSYIFSNYLVANKINNLSVFSVTIYSFSFSSFPFDLLLNYSLWCHDGPKKLPARNPRPEHRKKFTQLCNSWGSWKDFANTVLKYRKQFVKRLNMTGKTHRILTRVWRAWLISQSLSICTRIPWRSRTSVIAFPNIIFFPNPASVAKFWRIPPTRNSQIPWTLPESGTILWSNPGSPKNPARPYLAILRLRDGMCRCCLEWHIGTVLGEGTRPRGPFLERPGLIYGAEIKYSNQNLKKKRAGPGWKLETTEQTRKLPGLSRNGPYFRAQPRNSQQKSNLVPRAYVTFVQRMGQRTLLFFTSQSEVA